MALPDRPGVPEPRGNLDHFSARLEPEPNAGWLNIVAVSAAGTPFTVKNIEQNAIAREHYGVVVSRLQLETIDAPAVPRSNQITATLFDKGRNETNGE